ncbi:MAG: M28 family peptidase [Vicinamibacterales bacterium]
MAAPRGVTRTAGLAVGLGLAVAAVGLPFWYRTPGASESTPPQAESQTPLPAGGAFDAARAWEHLRQLVAIGPRPAGSTALRQARAYLTRQLASFGFTVEEQTFTAESPFGPVDMTNLIVTVPGRRKDRILIAGHYDTKLFPNQTFVGASDGASSAALLVELARVLKDRPLDLTCEVIWFDGEEAFVDWQKGLDHTYGSRFYVQAARNANALASLTAMILVDMIGDKDLQIRRDRNSTAWLIDVIWAAAKRLGHAQHFVDFDTEIEDDHQPFIDAGIPAVDLIDLDYPQWHTPADDLAHVSPQSLQIVGDVLLAALPDIEKRLAR